MVAQMRDNNDDKKEELTPKNILRILYTAACVLIEHFQN